MTSPWQRRVSPVFFALLVIAALAIAFVVYAVIQAAA
jgi:hypothetical protein